MGITKKKNKQARVTNIVLQKFTKELSIFGALSRGCRFCDFFVAERALQHNHPLFPLSRAISHENVFLKDPLESLRNSLGIAFQSLASKLEEEP